MAVGQGEHRLGLREHIQVKRGLAQVPGLNGEAALFDHESSDRSVTTTLAPCSRRASAWPTRSTPTTKPKPPARPASTPASASSNTVHSPGSNPSALAPARNVSGAGLPCRCSRSATMPSIRASNRSAIPAASSTCLQLVLDDTTARRKPAFLTAWTYLTDPG